MNRLSQTALALLVSLIMISSGLPGKKTESRQLAGFPAAYEDTTGLFRFLKVDTFNLAIIPPSSGIQFYRDRIVFLSLSKYERKMTPNQISFGTIEAYSAPVADTSTGLHEIFSPSSTFPYPCEAIAFSRDFNTVYFTRIPRKDKKAKIFQARFGIDSKNQKVLIPEPSPLEFCKGNFTYSHPTLSSDEEMIIFASDREGSVGGMDLWLSKKAGDRWTTPENLGKLVNTTGNEFYPFLDAQNNLYFSSDRHPGFGGFDIFISRFKGTDWDSATNLSDKINTFKDEVAFTLNRSDGRTAFFTRRQLKGKVELQLFRVSFKKVTPENSLLTISDIISGKTVSGPNLDVAGIMAKDKSVMTEQVRLVTEPGPLRTDKNISAETTINPGNSIEKTTEAKIENKVLAEGNKARIINQAQAVPVKIEPKDNIIYRIQLLPNASQKNSKVMVINGTDYSIHEYYYLGVLRYTIGEFKTLSSASALQKTCRQSGYAQSFVVAFKNNTRSLDPALFK